MSESEISSHASSDNGSDDSTIEVQTEKLQEYTQQIREKLKPGFMTQEELVGFGADLIAADNHDGDAEDLAEAIVGQLWEERLEEEKSWPAETSHDRLERAFNRLEAQGITAAMNFTCCRSCGFEEIGDVANEGDHAFVFFHQQDAERLDGEDCDLYLAFGDHEDESRAAAEKAGREVVQLLRDNGLDVQWEGNANSRIVVHFDVWQKRLEQ
ncbi:hypothetical protein DPSP01_003585 [Paraphaeosphaeria sporulosa]|uniref:DUF6891 domain-containing protein n=1 Tax=Paraphaeosphaeria sporulosa TaxID=1460663 RepID=A0A177BVT7_9PLEO|nr:uncharacterized protein CC84DRAFT_403355 [Paraphaeosphaeria sporulosa]OAF99444.1 hypothetical protein CC84DRAFT_403355 [Paraphaeosphaeria sporulosa]